MSATKGITHIKKVNVKLFLPWIRNLCLTEYDIIEYGGVEVQLHTFLTSVSGQLHAPTTALGGEREPSSNWIGSWVDSRAGLDRVVKRK
jgi:hypothetical protein